MVTRLRFGPARVPSRGVPEAAVELLLERGYSACEIDFEGGFWMDYPWAERFESSRRERHRPFRPRAAFAFPGHAEEKKPNMALGALDRSAGIAARRAPTGRLPPRLLARPRPRADARRRHPRAVTAIAPALPLNVLARSTPVQRRAYELLELAV